MASVEYASDDDVMQGGTQQHDDKRVNCINAVQKELAHVKDNMEQLAITNPGALRVKVLDTTTCRMMTDYCDALETLIFRFKRATNERDGKDAFREDIVKIESDMHVILAAGWKGYSIIIPAGGFVPASSLDASAGSPTKNFCMPCLDPSAPRSLRSKRQKVKECS